MLRKANSRNIGTVLRSSRRNPVVTKAVRFNSSESSLGSQPKEVFTKLTDENDPQRDAFFKYSWGTWLKNDALEKSKRTTKFSIEGTTTVLQDVFNLAEESTKSKNLDKNGKIVVKAPTRNADNTVTLSHNLSKEIIGEAPKDEKIFVSSMASIHEGKHHRVYKITTNANKSFVLRIPYPLDTEFATSLKVKSEVATLDFLDLKLGANVPKVISYGTDFSNPLNTPYILMEYLEGDLLMKKWSPLLEDEDSSQEKLLAVINPLADFNAKLLSVKFNKFGSLYFKDDVEATLQSATAYEGETNPLLSERWKIGPTTERIYSKDKSVLTTKQLAAKLGPWDKSKPLEIIKSVADIELEGLRTRLGLLNADSAGKVEDKELLEKMITTYTQLQTISGSLFNIEAPTIPNVAELFEPRLSHPDIDPMNVILHKKEGSEEAVPYFIDFENVSIKPFILVNTPQFVVYEGPKVYNLKEDIEDYENLDDVDKEQYSFMYKRTRNQYMWEAGLNERRKELISSVAPPVKLLRSPYVQAVERKSDKEHLYIKESIIQLQEVWELYYANNLIGAETFPIEFTADELDQHTSDLSALQEEIVSTPFAATKGWVPQDMFNRLKEQGIIVEEGDGYKIDVERAL